MTDLTVVKYRLIENVNNARNLIDALDAIISRLDGDPPKPDTLADDDFSGGMVPVLDELTSRLFSYNQRALALSTRINCLIESTETGSSPSNAKT